MDPASPDPSDLAETPNRRQGVDTSPHGGRGQQRACAATEAVRPIQAVPDGVGSVPDSPGAPEEGVAAPPSRHVSETRTEA